jgi:hypothetical protein
MFVFAIDTTSRYQKSAANLIGKKRLEVFYVGNIAFVAQFIVRIFFCYLDFVLIPTGLLLKSISYKRAIDYIYQFVSFVCS